MISVVLHLPGTQLVLRLSPSQNRIEVNRDKTRFADYIEHILWLSPNDRFSRFACETSRDIQNESRQVEANRGKTMRTFIFTIPHYTKWIELDRDKYRILRYLAAPHCAPPCSTSCWCIFPWKSCQLHVCWRMIWIHHICRQPFVLLSSGWIELVPQTLH